MLAQQPFAIAVRAYNNIFKLLQAVCRIYCAVQLFSKLCILGMHTARHTPLSYKVYYTLYQFSIYCRLIDAYGLYGRLLIKPKCNIISCENRIGAKE